MRWLFILVGCTACSSPRAQVATTEAHGPAPVVSAGEPPARAGLPIFAFHSGRLTNVHHWLHYAATGRRPPPEAAPAAPADPAWVAAVDYYRSRFGPKGGFGLIFDEELIGTHRTLSFLSEEQTPTALDPEHRQHLVATRELVDWPREHARNEAWVDALEPRVAQHGEAMMAALTQFYATPWPTRPIRVDVSCFAGPVGAYTVGDPVHITISSCDPAYAGEGALEMIFHEASHALSETVENKIEAAAEKLGKKAPRNLWHAVIFYTAGTLAQRRLGADYVPYAQRRSLWGGPMGPREPIEVEWQPYLDGDRTLDEAIDGLVARSLSP